MTSTDVTQKGRAPVRRTVAGQPSIIATMAERWGCSPEALKSTIIKTCLKGTSNFMPLDEQVIAFLIVAREYDLNPFMGEIMGFVKDGAVVPIIGVDGRVTLINRQPEYDGVEFAWGYPGGRDEPNDEKEMPVSCTCTMYHKNRSKPTVVTEFMAECVRNTGPWKQHPRRMLRHKALIQCGRIAFGLRMYDMEDFTELEIPDAEVVTPAAPAPAGLDMSAGPDSIQRSRPKREDGDGSTTAAPQFSEPTTTVPPVDSSEPTTAVPSEPENRADHVIPGASELAAEPDPPEEKPQAKPKPPTEANLRKDIDERALEIAQGDTTAAQGFVREWSAGLSDKLIEGWPIATVIPKKYLPTVANKSKAAYGEWQTPPETDSNGELELGGTNA